MKKTAKQKEDERYSAFMESWNERLDEITDDFLEKFTKMKKTYAYYLVIVYILGFAFGYLTKYLMQ